MIADHTGVPVEQVAYSNVMGVPVTYLLHHNPNQFRLIGHEHDPKGDGSPGLSEFQTNGRKLYKRLLIQPI